MLNRQFLIDSLEGVKREIRYNPHESELADYIDKVNDEFIIDGIIDERWFQDQIATITNDSLRSSLESEILYMKEKEEEGL